MKAEDHLDKAQQLRRSLNQLLPDPEGHHVAAITELCYGLVHHLVAYGMDTRHGLHLCSGTTDPNAPRPLEGRACIPGGLGRYPVDGVRDIFSIISQTERERTVSIKPQSIAQPTISEVLQEFLDEQRRRLKPRTFRRYEDVIELFQHSMNGYAYNYLDEEESVLFDELYNEQDLEFCDIFGPEKILENVDEFLTYFMVHKVIAGQELLKAAGTVTKKLARWLEEKGYATTEEAEMAVETGAEAAHSLPKAEKLASLFYNFAQSQSPGKVLERLDDRFTIERVEPGKLWLSGWMSPGKGTIGPITVPREITDLAEEGWAVTLWLGRTRRGWKILDVGNVYPM